LRLGSVTKGNMLVLLFFDGKGMYVYDGKWKCVDI